MVPSLKVTLVVLMSMTFVASVSVGAPRPTAAPYTANALPVAEGRPRVLLAPRDLGRATMTVTFHTGSMDDGIVSGLTRLSQHALLHANKAADAVALQREVYAAGGDLDVETYLHRSVFTLTAPRQVFVDLASRLLTLLYTPRLEIRGFNNARYRTLADQMGDGSIEELVGFVAGAVMLFESTATGADYSAPIYGDPLVVKDLPFKEVSKRITNRFTPANSTVVVAGGFDPAAMTKALSLYQGGRPPHPIKRSNLADRLPLHYDRSMHRELHMEVQVLKLKDAQDSAAARVLNLLANEHIMWTLRLQGITYSTGALTVVDDWLDFLLITVPVSSPGNVNVSKLLDDLLGDIAHGKVKKELFDRCRTGALGQLAAADHDSLALAKEVSTAAGRLDWFSPRVEAALKEMTFEEFVTRVEPWLRPNASLSFAFGLAVGDERSLH